MEPEGISNACTTKVMMNSPATNTEAMLAMDSGSVSFRFSGFFCFLALACKRAFPGQNFGLQHATEDAVPPGQMKEMGQHLSGIHQFTIRSGADTVRSGTIVDGEVNEQRAAHDIAARDE